MKTCQKCNTDNADEAIYCSNCGSNLSESQVNVYSPSPAIVQNAKGSAGALVCGIIGFIFNIFCCAGLILGIIAIILGANALKAINKNPQLQGKGMAIAGLILGIFDILLYLFVIIFYFAILGLGGYDLLDYFN